MRLRGGECRRGMGSEELLDEEHEGEATKESKRDDRRGQFGMVWRTGSFDKRFDAPGS